MEMKRGKVRGDGREERQEVEMKRRNGRGDRRGEREDVEMEVKVEDEKGKRRNWRKG